ncbi:MAG TPA: hypothetical protein VFV75_16475, partial [Candidatus Polarisedimenticolaceae bacterium]|nr:hypothetical protein [Candidatus Polarisedimenticolaceae bacterium]
LSASATPDVRLQLRDNVAWIRAAHENRMVVGSQARILYADEPGRRTIALAFNGAVREGRLKGPVVLGRDHHDVSGTDSPYRETADIADGSNACADMAVHNVLGDAFRGATWVSLHNGGGVGWGEAVNGGFGMVLDGSEACDRRIRSMIPWDVLHGVVRRAWAGHEGAQAATERALAAHPGLRVTPAEQADHALVRDALREKE